MLFLIRVRPNLSLLLGSNLLDILTNRLLGAGRPGWLIAIICPGSILLHRTVAGDHRRGRIRSPGIGSFEGPTLVYGLGALINRLRARCRIGREGSLWGYRLRLLMHRLRGSNPVGCREGPWGIIYRLTMDWIIRNPVLARMIIRIDSLVRIGFHMDRLTGNIRPMELLDGNSMGRCRTVVSSGLTAHGRAENPDTPMAFLSLARGIAFLDWDPGNIPASHPGYIHRPGTGDIGGPVTPAHIGIVDDRGIIDYRRVLIPVHVIIPDILPVNILAAHKPPMVPGWPVILPEGYTQIPSNLRPKRSPSVISC